MPVYSVQGPDGKIYDIEGPIGATADQLGKFIQTSKLASKPVPPPQDAYEGGMVESNLNGQPQNTRQPFQDPKPSILNKIVASMPSVDIEKIQASVPGRIVQGMRDPIDAAAQLLSRTLGTATSVGGLLPNRVSDYFGDEAKRIDQMNIDAEKAYQASRIAQQKGNSEPGIDVARLIGNVFSPANAAVARVLPIKPGMTIPAQIGTGATAGAVGGALTPVNTEQGSDNFAATKAVQMGLGALTGGVAAPILAKVVDVIAKRINSMSPQFANDAVKNVDKTISDSLASMGQRAEDLSAQQMQLLRSKVLEAANRGKQVDPAAVLRKTDFEALGIQPTQGQLTRNATQFAKERNLRGVANVGEPLMNRFETQNQQLQKIVSELRGNPSEPYQAGKKIIGALENVDTQLNNPIAPAYQAAKDSSGRYANVDVKGFSERANQALDEGMLGSYLPSETRNLLNDVSSGKIPLNVNNLVQLDRTLSAAQRAARYGTPEALAIGKVRDALNSANIEGNAGQEAKAAFDTAKGLAANRFSAHRETPALGVVAEGNAIPDNFVKQQIIGGNVEDVQKLAKILKNQPEQSAFQEARDQIGDKLMRAAFGENQAGDKLAAPERLSKAIREIGTEKLNAFFTQAEIEKIKQTARVAAYINSTPTAAPVNTSNTASAVASMLGKIPGVPASAALLSSAAGPIRNNRVVNAAMKANIPENAPELSPEQIKAIANLLSAGSIGIGSSAASPLR